MEQLLGIAEQKAVGLAVHLTNLLFNTPEQTQLVQMLQGQVGRLVELPLVGLFYYCLLQDGDERGVCQRIDEVSTFVFLATPFGSVFYAVGNAFADDALIELAILQLDEEPRHT